MGFKDALVRRANRYAAQHGLVIVDELGFGVHGIVFLAQNQIEAATEQGQSALEVHHREPDYRRERDAYLRLQEHAVSDIRGCRVPQLVRYDDPLFVLEMTVVTRPFVLDFGGAFLDEPPEFDDEVLQEWRADKQEQFGSHWSEVQAILRTLEGYGVFMIDVNPGNISFPD